VIALVVLALAAGGAAIYLATRAKATPRRAGAPPDAGLAALTPDAGLAALTPDPPVAVVPVPEPLLPPPTEPTPEPATAPDCFGTWGDANVRVTIDSTGDTCGSYAFGHPGFQCAGQLTGCTVTQARVSASFACKYGVGAPLSGAMAFSGCNPSGASGDFTVNKNPQKHALTPVTAAPPGKPSKPRKPQNPRLRNLRWK